MNEDKIGEAFGLEPDQQYLDSIKPKVIVKRIEESEEGDYEFVRDNMKELIAKGSSALEDLLFLAKQSENPRTYEVLSTLLKTIGEQNKDLIDIQAKIKGKKKDDTPSNMSIQKALFVGSTAELLKGLKEANE